MRGFERMTLANMRLHGVRSVIAACANCARSADVNVDLLPETLTVPETGKRLRCSSKTISTRPAWHTSPRQGVPDYRRERPPVSYAASKATATARPLQTGTGTAQTTAISTAAMIAAIFNLVDRSMASSGSDANLSAAVYAAWVFTL